MSIAQSLLSFNEQRNQAKVVARDSEIQAKNEELAGTQREADRKERLGLAISSANAQSGAGGIASFEGSPLASIQEDIRRTNQAGDRDEFNTRLSSLTARSRGKIQSRALKTSATLGLIKDVSDTVQKASTGGA